MRQAGKRAASSFTGIATAGHGGKTGHGAMGAMPKPLLDPGSLMLLAGRQYPFPRL